jgi:hypothetical protein
MPNPPFGNIYFTIYATFAIFIAAFYLRNYEDLYLSNLKSEEQVWNEIAQSENLEDAMIFVTKMIQQSESKKERREWTKIQDRLIELANRPL